MSAQTQLIQQFEKNARVAQAVNNGQMTEEVIDLYPPAQAHIKEKSGVISIINEYGNQFAVMCNDIFRRR